MPSEKIAFMVSFSIPEHKSFKSLQFGIFSAIVLGSDFKGKSQVWFFSCSLGVSVIICKKPVTIVVLGEGNLLFLSSEFFFFALSFFFIIIINYYK